MQKGVLLLGISIVLLLLVASVSAADNTGPSGIPSETTAKAESRLTTPPLGHYYYYLQMSGNGAGINLNNGPASYQVPQYNGRYYTIPAGTATVPARSWQNYPVTHPYPGVLTSTSYVVYLPNANVKVYGGIWYDGGTTKQNIVLGTPVVGPGYRTVSFNNNDYSGTTVINTACSVYNYGAASYAIAVGTWWYGLWGP